MTTRQMLLRPRHLVETGPRLPPDAAVRLVAPAGSAQRIRQVLQDCGVRVAAEDAANGAEPLAAEEYALDITPATVGEPAVVSVQHGERALRHALRTLGHLAADAARCGLPAVVVRDWPAVRTRGVIEGYYGPPWSHDTRLALLDFIHEVGLNAYFLSPKDDPYLREKWREPYPSGRVALLAELATKAAALSLDLIFAVSPGLDIVASDPADIAALIDKFRTAYDVGVRTFVVPFDDIDPLAMRGSDQSQFGADLSPAAAMQSTVVNAVRDEVANWPGCNPVQLVPTDYYQDGENDYRARLRDLLHPDVQVHWTGVGICAPTVTAQHMRTARALYGHEIVLWDNYPVNDYLRRSLVLGPYCGRDADAAGELVSVLANAMPQALASRIGFAAVAAWAWNPVGLDPEASWRTALATVGGDDAVALAVLAELCRSSPMAGRSAPVLAPVDELIDAVERGDRPAVARAGVLVTALGDRMRWAAASLRAGPLRELAAEIEGWVDALDSDGACLQRAAAAALGGPAFTADPSTPRYELAVGVLRPQLQRLAGLLPGE